MTDNETCVCPYDPSHIILKSRIQVHLVKCQKNHPHVDRETCPFNATHRIPRPEMRFHVAQCPNRGLVEGHKYLVGETPAPPGLVKYEEPKLPPSEENWDDDLTESTYEPSNWNANRAILRNLPGATKSKRKQFRCEERRRVAGLNMGQASTEPEKVKEDDAPLRLPKQTPFSARGGTTGSKLGMGRGRSNASDNSSFDDAAGFKFTGRGRGNPM